MLSELICDDFSLRIDRNWQYSFAVWVDSTAREATCRRTGQRQHHRDMLELYP